MDMAGNLMQRHNVSRRTLTWLTLIVNKTANIDNHSLYAEQNPLPTHETLQEEAGFS